MKRGFSTLELLIAFAIGSLIIVAVVSIAFGAQYWLIASQTSGEALYKAKTMLEDMRSSAAQSFELASSSPYQADDDCGTGTLCYYLESVVTDLSPCSKEAAAKVEWRIQGYGSTSTELHTSLADPNAIVSLGSDCPLAEPSGDWESTDDDTTGGILGTPRGLDTFDGITYIVTNQAPYLFIVDENGDSVSFTNGFTEIVPLNDIDVARDQSTGRLYAYVAREDPLAQLGIIEVTNPATPTAAATPFKLPDSGNAGFRVTVYARVAYVSTFDIGGREFTAVDVATPSFPVELGSADINTTAYDVVVRDEYVSGARKTLAYLATPSDDRVLQVWDVDDPDNMFERAAGPSGVDKDGRSVFLSGNKAYVGLESGTGDDLYMLDISRIASGIVTLDSAELGGSATAVRVSGDFAFVARTTGTDALVILNASTLDEIDTRGISNYADACLDLDGDTLYAASNGTLHRITSP